MPALLLWLVCCVLYFGSTARGKVDLFVSNEEVKRVLGLNATLAYVEDGLLNDYALKFQVPVPDSISQLFFHWISRAKENVYYSVAVKLDRDDIIQNPTFSIPPQGILPLRLESFSVKLQCNGRRNGEVGVDIHVNYTWPSQRNMSSIIIRRKKVCFRSLESEENLLSNQAKTLSNPGKAASVFYISIGGLLGFIIIIAVLLLIYFVRVRKPTPGLTVQNAYLVPSVQEVLPPRSEAVPLAQYMAVDDQQDRLDVAFNYQAKMMSVNSTPSMFSRSTYSPSVKAAQIQPWRQREVNVVSALQKLSIDSDRVELASPLLEGNFGQIFFGLLTKNGGIRVDIVGKTVKNNASESQVTRFLYESLMFHGLPTHPNVSFVVAAFCVDSSLPLLCYLHRGFGNLKKFLHRCSGVDSAPCHSLSTQDLVLMALHICRGLMHLHRHGIVHRDVAARNCFVTEDLVVQICDTGLSRDLFPQDYHCLGDNENRPVKWLAVESLEKHEFSTASDVWSLGVTIWELVSLAQQPYHEVDPFEMATFLKEDQRLYQPYNCPDELYGLMYCCWTIHPEARPTLPQLLAALEDFYGRLTDYI